MAMKHLLWTLSMLAVAAVTIGRPATVTAESIFCKDLQLRAVLQLNHCWFRCGSVGTRRHAKPSDVAQADCRWTCWDRYGSAQDRIQNNPNCTPPAPPPSSSADSAPSCTPNPDMCSARLSYVQSGCMLCRSYCQVNAETDGGDGVSCTKGCDEEFAAQKATILADCVCQDGPAPQ